MKTHNCVKCAALSILFLTGMVQAEPITSGNAVVTIDPSALLSATSLSVSRFFGGTEAATFTRSQVLSAVNSPPTDDDLPFNVNFAPLSNPTGRQRTASTLDFDFTGFDPLNPFASWSSSSPSGFGIAGGEQVSLDGVIRYGSPLGTLVSGDFALRYQANRAAVFGDPDFSGLVLVNLFDFPASSFDIGNVVATVTGKTLTIDGELLISPEFSNGFFGGTVTGFDVGHFQLTVTAIPEASTLALSATTCLLVGMVGLLRKKQPC
jgi:hypothetical protein